MLFLNLILNEPVQICQYGEMNKILISFSLILLLSCGKDSADSNPERRQEAVTQGEYLEILNQHRQALGLNRLEHSYVIEAVAYEHSSFMAEAPGRFNHNGWKGRCDRISSELKGNACSEIIAMGQKTPQAVFDSWYKSSSHRASLENPRYTHTGLGFVTNSKGVTYWTQLFLEVK